MSVLIVSALFLISCGLTTTAQKSGSSANQEQGLKHETGDTQSVPIIINCIQLNTVKGGAQISPCFSRTGSNLPGDELIK